MGSRCLDMTFLNLLLFPVLTDGVALISSPSLTRVLPGHKCWERKTKGNVLLLPSFSLPMGQHRVPVWLQTVSTKPKKVIFTL